MLKNSHQHEFSVVSWPNAATEVHRMLTSVNFLSERICWNIGRYSSQSGEHESFHYDSRKEIATKITPRMLGGCADSPSLLFFLQTLINPAPMSRIVSAASVREHIPCDAVGDQPRKVGRKRDAELERLSHLYSVFCKVDFPYGSQNLPLISVQVSVHCLCSSSSSSLRC